MKSTAVPGCWSSTAAARSRPPISGITRSVTSMSTPPLPDRRSRASGPLAASMTSYPASSSVRRMIARTANSSSTSRIRSPPRRVATGSGRRSSRSAVSPATGRQTLNVVPTPGSLCAHTYPFDCFTMPYTVARPRPVPWPTGLVVKNGSKTCASVSRSMPCPESRTAITVYEPGRAGTPGRSDEYVSVMSSVPVSMTRPPPCGIASRALSAILRSTCSSWPGSARTDGRSLPSSSRTGQSSPIARRPPDHRIHTEQTRHHALPAAEREELCRDGRGALRRLPDVLDVGPHFAGQVRTPQHEVRGTEHDAHLAVRLVGFSAGEPVERIHAVRLPKPLFAPATLRRIHADTSHVQRPPLFVARDAALVRDPAHGAVGPHDAELEAQAIPGFERLLHRCVNPFEIGEHTSELQSPCNL